MSKFTDWYAIPENRERHKAAMRKRYQERPQEYRDRATAWNKAHPEKHKEHQRRADERRKISRLAAIDVTQPLEQTSIQGQGEVSILPNTPGPGTECES